MNPKNNYLYLNVRTNHQLKVGDQFNHWVDVIEYVDNPLLGSHEKVCTYSLTYVVKQVISKDIFRLTVAQCKRVGGYAELDANKVFHTRRGHQFYPNGVLRCNLPEIGDEFNVIDKVATYDLVKGYTYSLHRYENDEVN